MGKVKPQEEHFKMAPWLAAYLDWPQTIEQLSSDNILHVVDAFHAGWEAAMDMARAVAKAIRKAMEA